MFLPQISIWKAKHKEPVSLKGLLGRKLVRLIHSVKCLMSEITICQGNSKEFPTTKKENKKNSIDD